MTERKDHTLLDFGVEIRLCPAPKPPETLPTATPSAVPVCVAPQKRNILDIPIPTRKDNGRMLTTIRADLRQAARKDYRKNGISHEVISQPIMLENRYSCSECGKYYDCLTIEYLELIATIKERYPRKRKNNVNPDPLRVLWKLYRICQRNCAIKKACYRENEKRLEEAAKDEYERLHGNAYEDLLAEQTELQKQAMEEDSEDPYEEFAEMSYEDWLEEQEELQKQDED